MKKIKIEKIIDKYLNLISEQCKCSQIDEELETIQSFSEKEAKEIGDKIGVDWSKHNLKNFTIGINVELEHGLKNPKTNVTNDDPIMTGKIALVHMEEVPGTGKGDDYYTLLKKYIEND